MTVGDGIFWGAMVASMVALFLGTKDRWRWKRIVGWGAGGVLGLSLLAGLGVYGYLKFVEEHPKVITEYWGIKLGSPSADVLFLKGPPDEKLADHRWVYKSEGAEFLVEFDQDKVVAVLGAGERHRLPQIGNVSYYTTVAELVARYGEPSFVGVSDDGLERSYNFSKYNLLAVFNKDGMFTGGMSATGKPRTYGKKIERGDIPQ